MYSSQPPTPQQHMMPNPNDPLCQQQQQHLNPGMPPMPPQMGGPPLGAPNRLPPHMMNNNNNHGMGPNGPMGPGPMCGPHDGPFLQQPNHIYVFTTAMANDAALSIVRGQNKSIIDYHRQLPSTIEFLKQPHLQGGHAMTPPPNLNGGPGRGPLPVPNDQLTVEQLKQRTEKLGKLKNLSSLIYPQSNPGGSNDGTAAPAAKRGRGGAGNQQANQMPPGHNPNMPPGSGPPFMNGPGNPNDMMYSGNGTPGLDQFNQMMPGYGGPQQQQQEWNKLSKSNFYLFFSLTYFKSSMIYFII